MAKYGDIVHYNSPAYSRVLRVRLSTPIVTPHGKPGFDAVIVDENGDPDIAGYFFTSVWLDYDQIVVEDLPTEDLQAEIAESVGIDCACSSGPESSMCEACARVDAVMAELDRRGATY